MWQGMLLSPQWRTDAMAFVIHYVGPSMTKRIRTVERDPAGGWIVRHPKTGVMFYDDNWRWNSRAAARAVVAELLLDR